MTSMTEYLENEVQNWWANGSSFDAAPSDIYIALHVGDPGEDASQNEVSASDYSRKQTSLTLWSLQSGSGPTIVENDSLVEFAEATNDWGSVSHISLWNSSSGGNAYWKGEISQIQNVTSGDKVTFEKRSIKIRLD